VKVVLTEAAIADLIGIARFIARDNPNRAVTFVAELEERCQRLGPMPFAYPLLPGREETGVRRRPHGEYLIFYRVQDAVEILHVLRGAQDYDAILFPED
jgi:toxin ParE1/3/4